MARAKAKAKDESFEKSPSSLGPGQETRRVALPVAEASSGGEPSARAEIRDAADKPDPTTIAQEEVLREE